ncbi:hypothetical protein [Pseudomonas sp. DC3000-4b1]|uniref:hypothetical protein n=1 Tax=unclassified Pseudomonas TaxID=196821 RepID=UPI003CF7EFC7
MSISKRNVRAADFNLGEYTLLQLPVVAFLLFLGISTIVLVSGLLLSFSFALAAKLISAVAVAIFIWWAIKTIRLVRQRGASITGPVIAALLAAALSGVLASSIQRPDIDDSVYAPKPVYYTEHPDRQLDQGVTWLAGLAEEPHSIVFQYYETAQAALAWTTHIEFLSLYHVAFPFVVGALMFLVVFLTVSLFEPRPWACLWATLLFVGVLLCLGETHRAFGNLSIARAFQGKFVFVQFGVFAWVYISLRYLSRSKRADWLLLLIGGIGMVGLTTTALVFLPVLSAVLWASYTIQHGQIISLRSFRSGVLYCAALVPVIAWGVVFSLEARQYVAAGSSVNAIFSSSFQGQLGYLVNPALPVTPTLFCICSMIVALLSPYRRLFLAWLIIPIVFMLNPWVAPAVIKYVTTENIYWRFFYLLPFPLIVPIAALCLYRESPRARLAQCGFLLVLIGLGLYGPTSVLRAENSASWELFSKKVGPELLSVAEAMKKALPEGSMLAPIEIASSVVLVTAKFPQYNYREDYLGYVLENLHLDGELSLRQKTARFLYENPQDVDARNAAQILLASSQGPSYVVLRADRPPVSEVIGLLKGCDYTEGPRLGRYQVFNKVVVQ